MSLSSSSYVLFCLVLLPENVLVCPVNLNIAGPTSFAPMIEAATAIVEETGGQYHVLLIIADGQVLRLSGSSFF